ncbi:hypothetical protein AB0J52_15060 [Spirillospora sp. NPDC049652]
MAIQKRIRNFTAIAIAASTLISMAESTAMAASAPAPAHGRTMNPQRQASAAGLVEGAFSDSTHVAAGAPIRSTPPGYRARHLQGSSLLRSFKVSWKSVNGSRYVSAWGTYDHGSRSVTIRGTLQDTRKDKYAAGLQVFVGESGKPGLTKPFYLVDGRGRPAPGRGYAPFSWRSSYNDDFGVRECLVSVRKPYKWTCGRWKWVYRTW